MLTDNLAVDIRQLQQFLVVVESGSLGRAAKKLNISEPALSKTIRRMEERLQVALLDRSRRGVAPTEFGRTLAARARFLTTEWQSTLQELGELRGNMGGVSRAGTTFSYAAAEMARATSLLHQQIPGARAIVRQSISSEIIESILDGSLDFGIITYEGDLIEPDILTESAGDNPIVVAARRTHPLATRENLHPADLADWPWIVPRSRELLREKLETLFTRHGLGRPRVAVETSGVLFALSYMGQTDTLAYIPRRVIEYVGRLDDFCILPVEDFRWSPKTLLLRRRGSSLSRTAQTHLKLLRETLVAPE